MTTGLNLRVSIWRMTTTSSDDAVGWAMVTGTVVHENVEGRLSQSRPSQIVLEQGLEADTIWTCRIRPASLVIYERDEVEVTRPPLHPHLNDRFRIRGVRRTSMHPRDGRGFIDLTLSRIERSRRVQ